MRGRVISAAIALALLTPATAEARRPSLRPVRGSAADSFLSSDGARYVAFGAYAHALTVLDTATHRRREFAPRPCTVYVDPFLGTTTQGYFAPGPLGGGRLLRFCAPESGPGTAELTDLRTGAVVELPLARVSEPLSAIALGSSWIAVAEIAYKSYKPSYINIATGIAYPPPPTSAHTWLNVNSSALVQPLCSPVIRPSHNQEERDFGGAEPFYSVIGAEPRWTVLEGPSRMPGETTLLVSRCGRHGQLALPASDYSQVQLGSGILTWIGIHGELEALRLATGRRWKWHRPGSFCAVVHTRAAIYAIPGGGCDSSASLPVYDASLERL